MAASQSQNNLVLQTPELIFGPICGIGYQFLKIDKGGDFFWNIRLPIVLVLGTIFFSLINYVNVRALKSLLGYYDAEVHKKDVRTYIPLCLMLLFPLQSVIPSHFYWPALSFMYFLTASLMLILLMKAILVLRIKRQPVADDEIAATYSMGGWFLRMAALAIGIVLFLFHQLTLAYDGFYPFFRPGEPYNSSMRHNDVTRKTYLYDEKIELTRVVPHEMARAIVGYKIIAGPEEGSCNPLPVHFDLYVEDDDGKPLARRRRTLDAADIKSRSWHDFEFDLSRRKGRSAHFTMKARPSIFGMGWRNLSRLLLHSPMDFSYYRNKTVQAAWSEPEIVPLGQEHPNIIWISVDTLRADALGCYGYERNVSPAIDSFAQESILFENAFSQSTWTLPSHLSMLTSRYPNEFGIPEPDTERLRVAVTKKLPNSSVRSISSTTLPEILRKHGYYCVGFTDGVFVSSYYGFHRGFHVYNEQYGLDGNSFRLAQTWLREREDESFFLFLHTYLVHDYVLGTEPTPDGGSEDESTELFDSVRSVLPDVADPEAFLSMHNLDRRRDWYDARIRFLDSYLDDFFSFLKEHDLYEDTVIVLTSDHGESFEETHNDGKSIINYHAEVPYDSQIRVPLILKPPSRKLKAPSVAQRDVSLLDVAPTILALLRFDIDPQFRGSPLLPHPEAAEEAEDSFVYATWAKPGGSIRENQKKYIYREETGEEEYYDLANDAGETQNQAFLQDDEMREMRRKYNDFISSFGQGVLTIEESAEGAPTDLRENLKALGYLD
jgi:arylsulfatase A-like enzyme